MLALSIAASVFTNFSVGHIICAAFSCAVILCGVFFERLVKLKWLTYGVLAFCGMAAAFMLFLFVYGVNDNVSFKEDAVIVLGAGIRGERVSLLLALRLDKAVEYYRRNPVPVIVSGGQGIQEDITEALAMERYLVERGVPQSAIIKEDKATSTYENLLHSKKILDGMLTVPCKTAVITNDFHIFRTASLAKGLGLDVSHYHANTVWYSMPLNYTRECLAVCKMWLLGR